MLTDEILEKIQIIIKLVLNSGSYKVKYIKGCGITSSEVFSNYTATGVFVSDEDLDYNFEIALSEGLVSGELIVENSNISQLSHIETTDVLESAESLFNDEVKVEDSDTFRTSNITLIEVLKWSTFSTCIGYITGSLLTKQLLKSNTSNMYFIASSLCALLGIVVGIIGIITMYYFKKKEV